jgi:hypothetical protein
VRKGVGDQAIVLSLIKLDIPKINHQSSPAFLTAMRKVDFYQHLSMGSKYLPMESLVRNVIMLFPEN